MTFASDWPGPEYFPDWPRSDKDTRGRYEDDWLLDGHDRPRAARIYDPLLGGSHNFAVDRAATKSDPCKPSTGVVLCGLFGAWLAEDLPRQLRAYLDTFGLAFGAFDFAVTADDRCHFLECNPNGQWGWLQDATGLPMAEAFAECLAED